MPTTMPPSTPPAEVQTIVVPSETPTEINSNIDTDSNSRSKSNSNSTSNAGQLNSQSNVNINNTSSVYSWGNGVTRPVPNLNLSLVANKDGFNGESNSNVSIVATLQIPLGGRTSKQHTEYTNELNMEKKLNNEIQLASSCTNIRNGKVTIKPGSSSFKLLAEACADVLVASVDVPKLNEPPTSTDVQNPSITDDIATLRKELDEYKKVVADQQKLLFEIYNKKPKTSEATNISW